MHKGWFNYTSQLMDPLERQLQLHPEVTKMVLTGHSMGGAVSTILGACVRAWVEVLLCVPYMHPTSLHHTT